LAQLAILAMKPPSRKTKAHTKQTLHRLFGFVNTQLSGRDWIAGARSTADAYLFVMIRWAHAIGIDFSDLTDVARIFAQMSCDADIIRALKAEGLA
jgi:glutathione S-transferase